MPKIDYSRPHLRNVATTASPPMTGRLIVCFAGPVLFDAAVGLFLAFRVEPGLMLVIGFLLMPVGLYVTARTVGRRKGLSALQKCLLLAAAIMNVVGLLAAAWLFTPITINRAT